MSPLEARFLRTLHQHGLRHTHSRKAIFAALQAASQPLALKQIADNTKEVDRASVYRTLALFEQLHIVSVLSVGWKKRFELAAPYKSHHHHIHCEQCGKTISIASPSLEKVIQSIGEQKGFHLHRHTLELSGCCSNCKRR